MFLPNGHGQEAQRAKQGPLQRGVLAITPAPLPPVGYLDRNQGQLKNETFTLVGYGVDIGDKKAQSVASPPRI